MAVIRIGVIDPSQSEKTNMEVPDDVEVRRLVEAIVEEMQLPTTGPSGSPNLYQLNLRWPDGRLTRLDEEQSLAQNEVQQDSALQLTVEMVAGCFIRGTKVILVDRREIPIEEVQTGDRLLSYSTKDRSLSTGQVVDTYLGREESYLVVNNRLQITPSHLVYANGDWRRAGTLRPGDLLLNEAGQSIEITSILLKKEEVSVYNLSLTDDKTFFAEGVLVHNIDAKRVYANRSDSLSKNIGIISREHGRVVQLRPASRPVLREEVCIARFELDGAWAVGDFSHWLNTLDTAYRRLNSLLFISREFDEEIYRIASANRAAEGQDAYREAFTTIVSAASRRAADLRVKSVRIASPGFGEFLGSLNPLKVIADFITAWRHENTVRNEHRSRTELERFRIKAEVAKTLLERSTELRSNSPNDYFIDRFLNYALEESEEMLITIAKDIRVRDISWHRVEQSEAEKLKSSNTFTHTGTPATNPAIKPLEDDLEP